MNRLNRDILAALSKNARTPFLQIAKKLGVSEGAVRKRVAKLVKEGVIEKFTIEISPEYQLMAIVCIKVRSQQPTHEVVKKLKKLGLEEVFEVAGRYDVICIAKVHSSYDLNELLEKIRATKDVVETESFTVLKKN